MRKILLTFALFCLVCAPVLAQGVGLFGGGGNMSAFLLANADVQKELKLTDDQKKAVTQAAKERTAAFAKAREDMDQEAFQKGMEAYTKATSKVWEGLNSDQKKRLLGIETQVSEKNNVVDIFKNTVVAKKLKLTEKQKDIVADYEKDVKELRDPAKDNAAKMGAAFFKKWNAMKKDSFTKLTKSFTADQKTAWTELKGEKFDLSFGGGFRPKGKGKDKPKDDL